MRTKPRRTRPTATELGRVEKIMEAQVPFRTRLGPKVPVTKRTGEVVSLSAGTIAVAEGMIAKRLNPERAQVGIILRVAVEVFGVGGNALIGTAASGWITGDSEPAHSTHPS